MILVSICAFLAAFAAVDGFSYSCPPENVLALVTASEREIDMNAVPLTVCGQKRTCAYSQGAPCAAKGQYASGVAEINGNIVHGCCLISPPVQEHQGDDCQPYIIETTDVVRLTTPARPPPFTKGGRPPSGGAGKGATPPKESVVMESKDLPPGQTNQYVKSITKLSGGVQGYTVTICTPRCGSSTTTTTTTQRPSTQTQKRSQEKDQKQEQQQPTQDQQEQPKAPPPEKPHPKKGGLLKGGADGGHHCFSRDMVVTTPDGAKRMDELRAGDQVLVVSSHAKPVFEPIEWLYHRDPEAEADFITVTTQSQRVLRLSPNHLIPSLPCSDEELNSRGPDYFASTQSMFARRLKVGTCIGTLIADKIVPEKVISITKERKRGIYSPITNQGTIIVNDVYVSCYSSFENHLAQQSVHSVLITLRHGISNIWSCIFGQSIDQEDSNVPLPLKVLLKVAELVVPANVFSAY